MKKLVISGWGPKLTLIIPENIFYLDLCDAINALQEIKDRLIGIEVFNFHSQDCEILLFNHQLELIGDNGRLDFTISEIELFEMFIG